MTELTVSGAVTSATEGGLKVFISRGDLRPSQKEVNETEHTEYRESYALCELIHHFVKGGAHLSKSELSGCLQVACD